MVKETSGSPNYINDKENKVTDETTHRQNQTIDIKEEEQHDKSVTQN
jgi:hypothetical protein